MERSSPCTFPVSLLKVESLSKARLFYGDDVDKSAFSSVDPSDDESVLSVESSDEVESVLSEEPFGYICVEAGKINKVSIKIIGKFVILYIVADE